MKNEIIRRAIRRFYMQWKSNKITTETYQALTYKLNQMLWQ